MDDNNADTSYCQPDDDSSQESDPDNSDEGESTEGGDPGNPKEDDSSGLVGLSMGGANVVQKLLITMLAFVIV